jgi:hypothetical protein
MEEVTHAGSIFRFGLKNPYLLGTLALALPMQHYWSSPKGPNDDNQSVVAR